MKRREYLGAAAVLTADTFAGCTIFADDAATPWSVTPYQSDPHWRFYGHDTFNSGRNPEAAVPTEKPSEKWSATLYTSDASPAPFLGSSQPTPAIVDDVVYVGGDRLRAIDRWEGNERWSVSSGYDWVFGTAMADGMVFSTGISIDDQSRSRSVEAFALDVRDRSIAWSTTIGAFEPGSSVLDLPAPPTLADEHVLVALPARRVIALDRDHGDELWRLDNGEPGDDRAVVPALDDRGFYDHRGAYSVESGDAERRWAYDLVNPVLDAPTSTDDGALSAETASSPFDYRRNDASVQLFDADGRRWRHETGGAVTTSPATNGDEHYCLAFTYDSTYDASWWAQFDARVLAIDEDGERQWTHELGHCSSQPRVAPILDGDTLVVATTSAPDETSGTLTGIAVDDGDRRWQIQVDDPVDSLACVGEAIYATTTGGELLGFAA